MEKNILYSAVMGPGALAQRTNIAEKLSANTPTPKARYAVMDLLLVIMMIDHFIWSWSRSAGNSDRDEMLASGRTCSCSSVFGSARRLSQTP